MNKSADNLLYPLLLLLVLLLKFADSSYGEESEIISDDSYAIGRLDFPDQFIFGASTSAYQIEGGYLEDGKGLNNWDAFFISKGRTQDGTNGDVADDHYHRYSEDIDLMHSLGLDAYRFSISWARILPKGRFGGINQAGIDFYNKLIDLLISKGIKPFVTIHHHDYPQELEDRYGGWLSSEMQEDFVYFAQICFESFGDRVKYWITINEPNLFAVRAYEWGQYPPAHCSPPYGNCSLGNSDVEPLIAVHNMLLGHGRAVKVYREQFQTKQGGLIGISEVMFMYEPFSHDDARDQEAARRALAFNAAWTYDPLVFGDYPPEMRFYHGSELPKFTSDEKALLKDSVDFIGINHYGTLYAKDCLYSRCNCTGSTCSKGGNRTIEGFMYTTGEKDGVFIGDQMAIPRFFVVPRGMEKIVDFCKKRYHNKPMFILENGYAPPNKTSYLDIVHDPKRIEYHKAYLSFLGRAIRNGADVRGYFIWSLLDTFEWLTYTTRFGLYYVEPGTLRRIPKLSVSWYTHFLAKAVALHDTTKQNSSAF